MKKDSICKFIVSACISIKRVGEETNPRVRAFSPNSGGVNFHTVRSVIIKH